MRLREGDAETLEMYQQRFAAIADSFRVQKANVSDLLVGFDPTDIHGMEHRLDRSANQLTSYLNHPVISGLQGFLETRVVLGREGLPHEDRIIDVTDVGFENRAQSCLQAIDQMPSQVEIPRIFVTGGVETTKLVLEKTLESLGSLFRLRSSDPAQLNVERREALLAARSGDVDSPVRTYELNPVAVIMGWLIDILIAIAVFVVPARVNRRQVTMPHVNTLALVIRNAIEDGRQSWVSGIGSFDLLVAFVGDHVSEVLPSTIRRDSDGKWHIMVTADESLPGIRAAQRLGDLFVLSGFAKEVTLRVRITIIQRVKNAVDGVLGRTPDIESDVVLEAGGAALRTFARTVDKDFRDRLLESEFRDPPPDGLMALKAEA